GFSARQPRETSHGELLAGRAASDALTLPLLVGAWGAPLDGIWGAVARESARLASAWVLCFNGRALRLCDGRNTFARGYLEFDLEALADHPAAMTLFWGAMRAEALGTITPAIAGESARHGVAVSASLRNGVREALLLLLRGMLAPGSRNAAASFDKARLAWTLDQAFTIVYRVLFLLFAESRSLVPTWHPLYRRSYTIEGLRRQAETPGAERGIWEALQAVSRLAHAGCHAGSLVVSPFNGRLFAPARAPLAETGQLDDRLVADALVALTTLASGGRRERVAFGDLGVEQLGAVYESVLDYEPVQRPAHAVPVALVSKGEIRKSSGTFYTPRAITEYLVRHTLRPLVENATAVGILRLKVLDPAMGSGALLVAACRYLAAAYEAALVRERGCFASDIGESDRAAFRRLVAQHCLYGVDLNPMAVQLARLSMWLTTLARGRPLSFLDHRFVTGDSLVGATLEDVARQPPGGRPSRRAPGPLPLFEGEDEAAAMRAVVPVRVRLAATPDDSAETVHDKERMLASTRGPASAMTALRRVADLWCACWFWAGTSVPQPGPAEFGDLAAALRSGGASLPERIARPRLDEARRIAERRRFLHW
ncbi:MAG TPA: N-6 DNA methylase, partial [Vicinamibacterales bacterium]|nr:N-6 DNA methylase [Vicinamibacterales bacterium]